MEPKEFRIDKSKILTKEYLLDQTNPGKAIQYITTNKRRTRLVVNYESFYDGNSYIRIGAQFFNKAAWSDVTCEVAQAAGYGAVFAPPYPEGAYGPLFSLIRVGTVCCGGLQKTICYDSTNMCKTDADFRATTQISDSESSPTCEGLLGTHFFHYYPSSPAATSWNAMLCTELAKVKIGDGPDSSTGLNILQGLGPTCCGSLAKTRCLDGSNMCKVDEDFKGTVDAHEGKKCALISNHLLGQLGQSSWNSVTCDSMASTVWHQEDGVDKSVLDAVGNIGEACCGSLAKTLCFDSMCKVDSDFNTNAKAGEISVDGSIIDFTCGGRYGITGQQVAVWRQAWSAARALPWMSR